jgi:hypothetical protein
LCRQSVATLLQQIKQRPRHHCSPPRLPAFSSTHVSFPSREAPLVNPHLFRFVGLAFAVPGVVSGSLPSAFALPAAYGDLVAALLAAIAIVGLAMRARWRIAAAWTFNIWGTLDLLFAIYQGEIGVRIEPGSLGAAFFIPTVVVPPLLVLHAVMFWLLVAAARRCLLRPASDRFMGSSRCATTAVLPRG